MYLLDRLKQQFTLIRVRGIPVKADLRWVFVLILMTGITAASSYFLVQDIAGSIFLGIAGTLIFFASVLVHELAHAVTARWEGIEVVDVVLHPFGGVSRFAHAPETSRAEFLIAIAGPFASLLLAAAFGGLSAAAHTSGLAVVTLILLIAALSNFLIALINILPGYPLDGGRVLRAFLWRQGRDLNEATLLTGRFGQIIGVAAIVIGIVFFLLRGEFFTGSWVVLIGVFLLDSASGIIRDLGSEEVKRVGDMAKLAFTLDPALTIRQLVDDILPMHRHGSFAVVKDERYQGLLILEDLKRIENEHWRTLSVGAVMRTEEHSYVFPDSTIAEAHQTMARIGVTSIAVIDRNGRFVGIFHAAKSIRTA